MIVDLFLLAACGGVFSVPLYAIIQDAAAPSERSRMIAANNIMNALFMVAGAAAAAALAALGLRAPAVLHIAAVANLFVALWIVRILPHDVYRAVLRWYFNHLHGLRVHGLENYKAAGDRVVIVANHQSYLDACLIAACLPDSPTFAIHTAQAAKWYFKPFLAAVETFPVDVQSPYSVKRMVEAVRDRGRKLMIFPEGRMTSTGGLDEDLRRRGDGRRQVAGAGRADLHRGAAVQPFRPHARQAAPALVPAGSTEHPAAGHRSRRRTPTI